LVNWLENQLTKRQNLSVEVRKRRLIIKWKRKLNRYIKRSSKGYYLSENREQARSSKTKDNGKRNIYKNAWY